MSRFKFHHFNNNSTTKLIDTNIRVVSVFYIL